MPEIVTGKPISIGGSVFRHEATGAGVVMVIESACGRLGWNLAEQRCVVQGFGNVGGIAATELHDRGAPVIAVSDISGGVYAEEGLSIPDLHAYVALHGSLEGYTVDCTRISNAELLELPCDILVLAAREDQVTAANAGNINARLVAEGANGPTSVEADAILAARGIPVLPDILTNAGGVTVSYFEWVQDLGRLFWDRDEIRQPARRQADRRVRPRLGRLARTGHHVARRGTRGGDPRGLGGARSPRHLPVSELVRDAMVREPLALEADRSAREAGEALARPDVRVVFVVSDRRLVGAVTRKTLVREIVAAGRDPETTLLGEIAERPEPHDRVRDAARPGVRRARGARPRARAGGRRRAPRRGALALGRAAAARRRRAAARPRGGVVYAAAARSTATSARTA